MNAFSIVGSRCQLRAAALVVVLGFGFAIRTEAENDGLSPSVGVSGPIGCGPNPKRVQRLVIDKPGVYENYLVDGDWTGSTLVKIEADDVTLRRCEIRNGTHNAVVVYAKNVLIESCRIHHALAGAFADQHDAHGITGRPMKLVVRNCDIGLVSGDCLQFDPGRGAWDDVLIERCNLWTAPLPEDAAGFRKGERPGENAVDTKQQVANPRSRLTIRDCLLYGWNQPGQISNLAALNLKDHIEATVQGCVLRDNEIAFRVRGGKGERGGAQVTIEDCAVYDSAVAVRIEDEIENLKIRRLGIGPGVGRKTHLVGGGAGESYEYVDEREAPTLETAIARGLRR